jgi:hypothetical protein
MQRLLGDVEITEEADERGEDTPRFGAIKGVEALLYSLRSFRVVRVIRVTVPG